MKLFIVFVLFFFAVPITTIGKSDSTYKKYHTTEKPTKIVDSLQEKYIDANKKFQTASEQLEIQKTIINSFGTVYTIITIIIALLGIALPILTYQFGIKPSQKALSDFENKFDKKIDEKVSTDRKKQIEQAFLNIKSNSNELKFNAVNFLSLTAHQGFEDEQLFQIYNILETVSLDINSKSTLSYLLSLKENRFALKYFADVMKAHDNEVVYNAIRYYCFRGIANFAKEVKDYLTSGTVVESDFFILLNYANTIDSNSTWEMMNNQNFVDEIRPEITMMSKSYFLPYIQNWKISTSQYQGSYFYQFMI